jgi:hypothetical protein
MANLAPDLTGAFIQRVESSEGRLTLAVDGVRRFGLLFGGLVVFEGVSQVDGSEPRMASDPPTLSGGTFVSKQHADANLTVLDLEEHTGPGDVYRPRFAITHSAVSSDLRLRAAKTLRSWVGFYPRPRDLTFSR